MNENGREAVCRTNCRRRTRLLPEEERAGLGKVLVRSWTLGELITALGSAGLPIRAFEEIPSAANPQVPEFFTIVADKINIQAGRCIR